MKIKTPAGSDLLNLEASPITKKSLDAKAVSIHVYDKKTNSIK